MTNVPRLNGIYKVKQEGSGKPFASEKEIKANRKLLNFQK